MHKWLSSTNNIHEQIVSGWCKEMRSAIIFDCHAVGYMSRLGGLRGCRKSSETKPDKQVHADEELPRPSYAPTIRLPMRGATGNCPRICMVRFPRRQTEQTAAGRPTGKSKRMCQDGLDALSENDVPQLKTVRVEPTPPG